MQSGYLQSEKSLSSGFRFIIIPLRKHSAPAQRAETTGLLSQPTCVTKGTPVLEEHFCLVFTPSISHMQAAQLIYRAP